MAQDNTRYKGDNGQKQQFKIENFISDLTPDQRIRIDLITRRSSKTIQIYKTQLGNVRDSIRSYMASPEDQSAILFPLYEREGMLLTEISKEYYRSKVAIDELLTPKQFQELHEKMANRRKQSKHCK